MGFLISVICALGSCEDRLKSAEDDIHGIQNWINSHHYYCEVSKKE